MTSPTAIEAYAPESAPNMGVLLQGAAAAHGMSLEPHRLAYLTGIAEDFQQISQSTDENKPPAMFWGGPNDVEITPTVFSERFQATAARVHFDLYPPGKEDAMVGFTSAHPEHATRITLMAIHGLQDYALLADAGMIEPPKILYGSTNPQMAIVAERIGLHSDIARAHPDDPTTAHTEMRKQPELEVSGSFDEVRERIFSEETHRLERVLARRLSAQEQMGTAALGS